LSPLTDAPSRTTNTLLFTASEQSPRGDPASPRKLLPSPAISTSRLPPTPGPSPSSSPRKPFTANRADEDDNWRSRPAGPPTPSSSSFGQSGFAMRRQSMDSGRRAPPPPIFGPGSSPMRQVHRSSMSSAFPPSDSFHQRTWSASKASRP
jgi:hypothetical protein